MSAEAAVFEGFRQLRPLVRETVPEVPILDPRPLEALRGLEQGSGTGLVAGVVSAFLGSLPLGLSALRQAAARRDPAAVERLARSIRGSCAVVGARRLAERVAATERAAWAIEGQAEEDLRQVESDAREAEDALRAAYPETAP